MNRWLRLIGYGLCCGTTWKLLLNLTFPRPPGIPDGTLSITLYGWSSLIICPFIVFLNHRRTFDDSDQRRLNHGRFGQFCALAFVLLTILPLLLGYRYLWWIGLVIPMILAETVLRPTNAWEIMDVFDRLLNRSDQEAGRA